MRVRDVFLFWLPLFASWAFMTSEGPILSAAINRLPDPVVMLAAMGIVYALAVAIESPIINLLSTATALVEDRDAYVLVRRFTLHAMAAVTAVSAAVAWTPLFDWVVRDLLGTPPEVAAHVRPGLQIMALWSAAIAWRRFLQGILIRAHRTRLVAWGTAVRLVGTAGTAVALALWGRLPGVHLGATALMVGVVAEAVYATVVARPTLARLAPVVASAHPPLTYRRLLDFHLPLAGTSVLTLLVQPLVTAALARLPDPTLTLAAWPLVFQALLFLRAPALALPEVVIALAPRPSARRAVDRFSLTLAAASFLAMIILVATPLATLYLGPIQNAPPDVAAIAHRGLLLFLPLPALAVLVSWLRGHLIHARRTKIVHRAMAVRLAVTVAILAVGVAVRADGMAIAAAAIVASVVAELGVLWGVTRRASPGGGEQPTAAR